MKNILSYTKTINLIGLFIILSHLSYGQGSSCNDATILQMNSFTTLFTVSGTGDVDSPLLSGTSCTTSSINESWFKFTAASSGYTYVTFQNSGNVTGYIYIYSGSCGSLSLISCDQASAKSACLINLSTVEAATYYVRTIKAEAGTVSGRLGVFTNPGTKAFLCLPDNMLYATGNANNIGKKEDNTLIVDDPDFFGGRQMGWARLNTTSIEHHDSITAGSLALRFFITCQSNNGAGKSRLVKSSGDPLVNPYATSNNTNFYATTLNGWNAGNTYSYLLNPAANSDFLNNYSQNWWAICIVPNEASLWSTNVPAKFYGYNDIMPPFMVVTYSSFICSPPHTPTITSSGSITYCVGGTVILNASEGASSYLWSTGETSQSITVTESGYYTVKFFDSKGCSSQSAPFLVGSSPIANPGICMVGVDNTSGHNMIVWNKPSSSAIKQFNVYSEGSQANVFELIGTVPYASKSIFIDMSSIPAQQSYLYMISVVDTCNAETALSSAHKTIHLTINQGMGNAWNLMWNNYEGFAFPSYKIYRGTDPSDMTLLTTLSSSINSYTDLNPPAGYVYYQIEAVNPNPCSPSKADNYNSTRSNIATNNSVWTSVSNSIPLQNYINIYPNPANSDVNVFYPEYSATSKAAIELYNITGKLIRSHNIQAELTKLDISDLAKGLYFIKVTDNKGVVVKRLIKE